MNIFVLHEDPRLAAQMHCNKHVVKMVSETAQMLSVAVRKLGLAVPESCLMDQTHPNHTCTVWVRASKGNFQWTVRLLRHLLEEFDFRYCGDGKNIKSNALLAVLEDIDLSAVNIPEERTTFVIAMPEEYRLEDPVSSYRNFYNLDKYRFAKWTKRRVPAWFNPRKKYVP